MSKRIPYVCTECGGFGCKLWRTVVAVASNAMLYCGDCGLKQAGLYGVVSISGSGVLPGDAYIMFNNQIYNPERGHNLVPAIPADNGMTFWGSTSHAPAEAQVWWRELPLQPSGFSDPHEPRPR